MQQVKVKNVYDHMGTTELFLGRGWKIVEEMDEADIVCLNGGMDIASEIYGEPSAFRGVPETMSPRDKMEIAMYNMALERGKFILGICRGAQLANCLNGGKLWQHISNHGSGHMMFDRKTNEHIFTTSVHHQEMIPGPDAEIIAVAAQATQKIDSRGVQMFQPFKKLDEDGDDIEVLWYPKTRSLCIQGHPEFAPGTKFASYCFKLIESLRVDGVWPAKAASGVAAG